MDEELDEFGIPIKKKSVTTDEFGIPIKEKPSEPKEVQAEGENGELKSPSANTASSLDSPQQYRIPTDQELEDYTANGGVFKASQQLIDSKKAIKEYEKQIKVKEKEAIDKGVQDLMNRQKYPELMKERDSLVKQMKSMSIMSTGDLDTRVKEIDKIINSEPKSYRKIRKERLNELDSLIAEQQKKDYRFGANGGYLENNGTYEQLQKERKIVKKDIDNENAILNKIKSDDTFGQSFLKSVSFGWYHPERQTLDLSEDIEEEILSSLDNRTRESFIKGGSTYTAPSLKTRERIVRNAKAKVFNKKIEEFTNTKQILDNQLKTAKTEQEKYKINKELDSLSTKTNQLLVEVGYDKVNNKFNDSFNKIKEGKELDESLKDNGGLDNLSTFVEGLADVAVNGLMSGAGMIATIGGAFTDDDTYSYFDALSDGASQIADVNFMPSSHQESGKLMIDGKLNITPYSAGKNIAQMLPFTLALVLDARKGNVKDIETKLAALLNPKNAADLAATLRVGTGAYRKTLIDNITQAEELGVTGRNKFLLGNGLSVAEGVFGMIMPEHKFFSGVKGQILKKEFAQNLKQAVNKEAATLITKDFIKNNLKELSEEELTFVSQELMKLSMVDNYDSSIDSIDAHGELILGTLALGTVMGGVGLKEKIGNTKTGLYEHITTDNYKTLTSDIKELINTTKSESLRQQLTESLNHVGDIMEAKNKSPKDVSSKQIDLLIEKKHLIQEMKSMDDSFHPEYKEKIEKINENIRKEASLKKSEAVNNTEKTKTETKQGEGKTESEEKVGYNVLEQLKSHNDNGGSTFTLDGKNRSGEKGVSSVSIFPERSKIIDGKITEQDISEFKEANKDLLEGNEDVLAIGTWFDKKSGKTYLDVSAVTDTDSAIKLGKQYNQKAVFNLETFKEIDTKGNGTPIKNLKSEVDRVSDIRSIINESNKKSTKVQPTEKETNQEKGKTESDKKVNLEQKIEIIDTGKGSESKEVTRTNDVEVVNSPKNTMINVGMKRGKTNEDISEQEIKDALPKDVKVINSGIKTVESDGGTENTLSLELSRPLTDSEMNQYLQDTGQMAIPQISDGKGAMYGTKDWGNFNPEYFSTPDGKMLNEVINESNKKSTKVQPTEKEGTKTNQTGTDKSVDGDVQSSKSKKYKKIADEVRKLKTNNTTKNAMSKLQSNPIGGLFTGVWDGAIETVATTIEVSGDIHTAIEEGIKYLKNTDWYKSLSSEGKIKAVDIFKKDAFQETKKNLKESSLDIIDKNYTKRKLEDLYSGLADKYHYLRKLQRQLEKINNKNMSSSENFDQAETALYGKTADEIGKFDKTVDKLVDKIIKMGLNQKQVYKYLYAKHATERNKYVKENIDSSTEAGSGMTNQEAKDILGLYSKKELANLDKLWKEDISKIAEATRNKLVETGLMSKEAVDELKKRYKYYVPLNNFADVNNNNVEFLDRGGKISIKGKEFKKTKGRKSEAGNPLANLLSQHAMVIVRGNKNIVMQSLYTMLKNNPEPDSYRLYSKNNPHKNSEGKRIPMEMADGYVGVKINGEQHFILFENRRLGHILNAANIEKTRFIEKTFGKVNRYLSSMMTSYNPEFVISNFSRDLPAAVFNLLSEIDISNNSVKGKKIVGGMLKSTMPAVSTIFKVEQGLKTNSERAKYYKEFKEDGAKTGWFYAKNATGLESDINALFKMKTSKKLSIQGAKRGLKASLNLVENINSAVENGVRLSAYMNARKAGVTRADAAHLAKELTVNFNKSGEWGAVANSFYLFFNASVQGTVRFTKSMINMKKVYDSDGNVTGKKLNNAQKAAVGMIMLSAMTTLLNQSMSDDDDDGRSFFSKIPDYDKERNFIIMKPNGKDYFKIPLPYGYNIFHNLGSIATEVSTGERSVGDGAGFMFNSTIGAFSPVNFADSDESSIKIAKAVTPTVFKPILELAVNENHFGAPIYKENSPFDKTPTPDSYLGRTGTNKGFKQISKFLNDVTGGSKYRKGAIDIAPDTFKYLLEYYTAGLGKFTMRSIDTGSKLIKKSQGDEVKIKVNDVPFLRKFIGEPNDYSDLSDFYKNSSKIRSLYEEYNDKKERKKDKSIYKGVRNLMIKLKKIDKELLKIRKEEKKLDLSKNKHLIKYNKLEIKKKKQIDLFNRNYYKYRK